MESLLSGAKWKCERLSATRLAESPESIGLKMIPRLAGHKGVASIWLSHQRALNRFLAVSEESEKSGAYVLLEDDVNVLNPAYLKNPLPLPTGLSGDWEIILLSPRFRWNNKKKMPPEDKGKAFVTPFRIRTWINLKKARENFIITGAHYVIFRNRAVVSKVLDRMKERSLHDVDGFYASNFKTYGIRLPEVTAGGFDSDHNYE
jgi:hypothetical protein